MSNADGNVIGVEAQLNWWLWRRFTELVANQIFDEPATFVPVQVATPEVEADDEIADTVLLELVNEIGCYKMWLISDWLAYAADPTDGEGILSGNWNAVQNFAYTPLAWEEALFTWGKPPAIEDDEDTFAWVPPRDLYLLTVRSPWTRYANSDGFDVAITVIQADPDDSLAVRWAKLFSEAGADHALFLQETQTDIAPGDSQPAAMNFPIWKERNQ